MFSSALPLPSHVDDAVLQAITGRIRKRFGTAVVVWSRTCEAGNPHLHYESLIGRCPRKFQTMSLEIQAIVSSTSTASLNKEN